MRTRFSLLRNFGEDKLKTVETHNTLQKAEIADIMTLGKGDNDG